MNRYIIANRTASLGSSTKLVDAQKDFFGFLEKAEAEMSLNVQFQSKARRSQGTEAQSKSAERRTRNGALFAANDKQISELKKSLPSSLIIEPDIRYFPQCDMCFTLSAKFTKGTNAKFQTRSNVSALGTGKRIDIAVSGDDGAVVHHASAILFTQKQGDVGFFERLEGMTDPAGVVSFDIPNDTTPAAVILIPYAGYWAIQQRIASDAVRVNLVCPSLPAGQLATPWHSEISVDTLSENARGNGIKIGVIDTGCGNTPSLTHVQNLGSVVGGVYDSLPHAGDDIDIHGTHVCGTIGARSTGNVAYSGVASAADLYSIRVFGSADGATILDIAEAIDIMAFDQQLDLVNMSLGSPVGSEILRDAIEDARDEGTFCIAAAGNSSGAVNFPAATAACGAISAVGYATDLPNGSISASRMLPRDDGQQPQFADFSCFGTEINACSVGVGLIAPVPERHGFAEPFAALDGTSMACPAAVGTLACDLAQNANYLGLPRSRQRAEFAEKQIAAIGTSVGLRSEQEGLGLLQFDVDRYSVA